MRRRFLTVLILSLGFSGAAFSQQRWERNYGGADHDWGYSVQQTSDGGYIIAGETASFGNGIQFYLVKTNANGDTLWTRTYGGTDTDRGYSVQQTQDGGYIVTGWTSSFGNWYEVYLVKTNTTGDTLWTQTYGGANEDYGYSVQQTSDEGYIIAGNTRSFGNDVQVYLVKTNASGDTLWTRSYGGTYTDRGYSVQQTSDGGYIIAGCTYSFGAGYADFYLIKTNASGDTLWTRTYGGANEDYGYSVQQTTDGGYIVGGWTRSFGDSTQVYLVKTNATGDTLWTRNYGGWGEDYGWSVQQTSDSGYIVTGEAELFGSYKVCLLKTNASGDTLWTQTYGGVGIDWGYSVQQTTDGGYIVAGVSGSVGNGLQVYLIKTDVNGNVGVEESRQGDKETRGKGLTATPNPFTSFATVPGHETDRFALYDVSGRRVGTYKGDRIGEGLEAGVYFVREEGKDGKPLRIVKVR